MLYPDYNGFLGTRASFMLDFVFLAMFVVVFVMSWSIYLVVKHRRYKLHKQIQIALGLILLVAVSAFEIDIRIHGWKHRALGEAAEVLDPKVWYALYTHLVFAISSTILWPIVIVRAIRNFAKDPLPNAHSRWHRRWAKIAAIDMTLTAVTGWIFYWFAFC